MSKSQILVVDDDSRLREAIIDTLVISGYECREASGGNEALDLLSRINVDMVISDIQMDGMNGIDTARALRKKSEDTVLIFVTGVKEYVFDAFVFFSGNIQFGQYVLDGGVFDLCELLVSVCHSQQLHDKF